MPIDHTSPRVKRKDAALNTERLVQAAREVFASQGLAATLEDIAKHAGVGVGTVYRNFASKREIVETLYSESLEAVLSGVRTALTIDDPWQAIVAFFEGAAEAQARDRGLCEMFLGLDDFAPDQDLASGLISDLTPVFERAHAAGVLREGVVPTDVGPIFAMLYGVYGVSESHPELWRRYLAILLDGLRADGRPPLPVPAMDAAAFTAAIAR